MPSTRRFSLSFALLSCLALCWGAAPAQAQVIFQAGFEGGVSLADAEAARLLSQASFGASTESIAEVRARGINGWIDHQLTLPATRHLPYLDQVRASGEPVYQNVRLEAWLQRAMYADDEMRQKMAYALSQIFVISDASGGLEGNPFAMAQYYDLLLDHAFGSYRELLEAVTLHPTMGVYLSMMGNQKPNLVENIRPDENYAREIMQLFSIGLVMLNPDGTVMDGDPGTAGIQPIPTYDQDVIRGFAHVFTGWKWQECADANPDQYWIWTYCGPTEETRTDSGWRSPMLNIEYQHDTALKTLLGYAGVNDPNRFEIAAGGTAPQDLESALDILAGHPNVAPFISKQLIQRLVSSNPSPAYVARISAVFNNDGQGNYGNLGAVLRAILTDIEARDNRWRDSQTYGKLREPFLKWIHLLRAMRARSESGRFYFWYRQEQYGQAPLSSPSVFNFYFPYFSPNGPLQDAGLAAPEAQIITDTMIVRTANDLTSQIYWGYIGNPYAEPDNLLLDLAPDEALADRAELLIDRYDLLFMSGQMPSNMRQLLIQHVSAITSDYNADWRRDRVRDALALILTSAQYAVQR
ncbi:DUF1800 domain-containing protein [Pseudomarimonas arenosa]|uniref:DUF1800 domain-containing protein n=1 Tax=Pseudomarimonas arenosa TaxID=2774145 RepID=A0AAW3ZLQ6_9GAMM|nr:DUF1800 domain-containing protein [Pseudomarimonas arenosa]MBD8525584.1 DUF1800 domain-containing protein [Pseudomarimonas arenosa]